jgi:hypothetical protein
LVFFIAREGNDNIGRKSASQHQINQNGIANGVIKRSKDFIADIDMKVFVIDGINVTGKEDCRKIGNEAGLAPDKREGSAKERSVSAASQ